VIAPVSPPHLLTRRDGPVEYLTLNRPDVRNAFNDALVSELAAWATDIALDRAVRVVVVAGAGPVFCAGADAAWMARMARYTEDENRTDALALAQLFAALDRLPVPVVGRVHGAAIGGGAGLAAVCDIVVAEERAMFGFTEVRLGIVPAVISPFVIAKIGRSAARELFLTGARFSATRAKEIGLVHMVTDAGSLDHEVARCVTDLLHGAPGALAAAKALVPCVALLPLEEATALTARTIAERRVSSEGQEGLRAFLEKRPPAWTV
jgi:methylglutaconyl-CoA hydratase